MKPAPFTLHRPGSVAEAVALLAATAEEGGLILAGGQTLTPMMALRVAFPPDVIDINAIPGLDRVEEEGGALRKEFRGMVSDRLRTQRESRLEALEQEAIQVLVKKLQKNLEKSFNNR